MLIWQECFGHGKRRSKPSILRCGSRRYIGVWSICSWLGSAEKSCAYVSRSCVRCSCVWASCSWSSCSSTSCVSSSTSFVSCACASLTIALNVAARSDLQIDCFEDALLSLGLLWARSWWASADSISSSCQISCLAAVALPSWNSRRKTLFYAAARRTKQTRC